MNLLNETFSAADVVIAANISPETLQNWIKRDLIVGQSDGGAKIAGGGSRGKRRQYSWENLMDIVTAAAFVEIGIAPVDAFKIAHRFSMRSDAAGAVWDGEAKPNEDGYRIPALPFHHASGETYLFSWAGKRALAAFKDGQINLDKVIPTKDRPARFAAVNMSELFNQVAARLGLGHPLELLDGLYSK